MFKHCDPAGIAFYPRYFEIINDAVETMFDELLSLPFSQVHPECKVPTVALDVEFKTPSMLDDILVLSTTIRHLGRTSLTFETVARVKKVERFRVKQTLVYVGKSGAPDPWPDHVAEKINALIVS